MRQPMTKQEINTMIKLYQEGQTCKQISTQLNRGPETIRKNLKKLNIKMREYRDYYAYKLNDDYFEIIDTEEKSYWLGFLLADGCISQSAGDYRSFHFNLQRKDKKSIEDFKNSIKFNGEVKDFEHKKNNKTYLKSGIDFNNKNFCNHLLKLGWIEFKKEDNPYITIEKIDPKLLSHLTRGFFDGDGCISRNKKRFKSFYINFSGSKIVLETFRNIISKEVGLPKAIVKPSKTDKSYRLSWNGNKQIYRFGKWLYNKSTIYMKRKHDRFKLIFDHYDNKLPQFDFDNQNNFNYPLSYKEISELSYKEKTELINQFEEKISKQKWTYPQYSKDELTIDIIRLKDDEEQGYNHNDGLLSSKPSPLGFPGKKVLTHFQKHYWDTKYMSKPTLVEGWNNPKIRRKACENLFLTRGGRPNLERYLRELNISGARRVSHFHPGFAKAILKKYCPNAKSYLDPCAGWGARLLASYCLNIKYTCVDPNPKTCDGLKQISKFLDFNTNIINSPFEKTNISERFDIIFTSPPYFSLERYEHGEQSYLRKTNFTDWYYNFLVLLIKKCQKLSDIIILHVSDKIKKHLLKTFPKSEITNCHLQRSPGQKKSCEFLVKIIN
jgi:intein-encoded DNA endonuclease-like protein/16S rRNA G966 N2-methylase RsmD